MGSTAMFICTVYCSVPLLDGTAAGVASLVGSVFHLPASTDGCTCIYTRGTSRHT